MNWLVDGTMTMVLLATLGFMSFWVARSIDVVGQDVRDLRGEISELRGDLGSLGTSLRGEISGLRGDMGSLETSLRGDIHRVETTVLADHGERITRLEARFGS